MIVRKKKTILVSYVRIGTLMMMWSGSFNLEGFYPYVCACFCPSSRSKDTNLRTQKIWITEI